MTDRSGVAIGPDGERIDIRTLDVPRTIADLIDMVQGLVGSVDTLAEVTRQHIASGESQREGIQQLTDSVGALVQCVAMVMEEELGTPIADEPKPVETDWDGNPVG